MAAAAAAPPRRAALCCIVCRRLYSLACRQANQQHQNAHNANIHHPSSNLQNLPFYRIVVADAKARRDGRHLEQLGWYDPHPQADGNKHVGLSLARVKYWLGVGAQPSERATYLLARAGLIPRPPAPPRFPKPKAEGDGK